MIFHHLYKGEQILLLPVFFPYMKNIALKMGSTLKGKNLLLKEQILSLRVDPAKV